MEFYCEYDSIYACYSVVLRTITEHEHIEKMNLKLQILEISNIFTVFLNLNSL